MRELQSLSCSCFISGTSVVYAYGERRGSRRFVRWVGFRTSPMNGEWEVGMIGVKALFLDRKRLGFRTLVPRDTRRVTNTRRDGRTPTAKTPKERRRVRQEEHDDPWRVAAPIRINVQVEIAIQYILSQSVMKTKAIHPKQWRQESRRAKEPEISMMDQPPPIHSSVPMAVTPLAYQQSTVRSTKDGN